MSPRNDRAHSGARSGGLERSLLAEWTTFRASRVRLLGVTAAALMIVLLGVLAVAGQEVACGHQEGSEEVEEACPAALVGPDGTAISDRFSFMHQSLTGDGSITVRLTSMTGRIKEPPPPGTQGGPPPVPGMVPWAKAGVMIKDGLSQGAPYAAVMATAEHGVRMQHNFTHDTAGKPGGVSAEQPRWLRLTREGDTLTGYESFDGEQWIEVGTVQVDLPETVQIGMFAASPGDLTTTGSSPEGSRFSEVTAVFDQVSLEGPWKFDDIGVIMEPDGKTPHHPGGVQESGGRFTLTGTGDIGPAQAGDAGVKVERMLSGTFAGMIALIVVAVLFITAGPRRGPDSPTVLADGPRTKALAAKATVVALVAFATGLVAALGAVLVGTQILGAKDVPIYTVPWPTEARMIVGTAALLAAAAVFGVALGALFRRGALAVVTAIATATALLIVPDFLGTSALLPLEWSQWLLRVTPAAGFAVQQSVPDYAHVITSGLPQDGHYPLAPWAGLAVAWGFAAATLAWAMLRLRRHRAHAIEQGRESGDHVSVHP